MFAPLHSSIHLPTWSLSPRLTAPTRLLAAASAVAAAAVLPFEAAVALTLTVATFAVASYVVARARIDAHLAGLHGSSFDDPADRQELVALRRLRLGLTLVTIVAAPLIVMALLIGAGDFEPRVSVTVAMALCAAAATSLSVASSAVGPVDDRVWAYAETVDGSRIGRRSLRIGRLAYIRAIVTGSV